MTKSRLPRIRRARSGQLIAYFGRCEKHQITPDICTVAGGDGAIKADGAFLMHVLTGCPADEIKYGGGGFPTWPYRSLLAELEARGYDLATLKFSIERTKS